MKQIIERTDLYMIRNHERRITESSIFGNAVVASHETSLKSTPRAKAQLADYLFLLGRIDRGAILNG